MDQQRLQADLKTLAGNTVELEGKGSSIKVRFTKGIWPCASSLQVLRIGVDSSDPKSRTGPVDLVNDPGGGDPSYKACPNEYRWFYELMAPLTKL